MQKVFILAVFSVLVSFSSWASASSPANLALNKPVVSSSQENATLVPQQAVDGNSATRWSSDFTDHNWITVDLQAHYDLSQVRIHWQNSYSKDYDIKVSDDGETWSVIHSVNDSDGGWDEWNLSGQGRYLRIEGYRRATRWGHSIWELEVYGTPVVELVSLNRPAYASSVERSTLGPGNAVDGLGNTRWSSDFTDHNWIYVDLGQAHQITRAKLFWQNSYSKDYQVQTSYDGETWTVIHSVENSDGGLDDLVLNGHGRYVRIEGFRRATRWGHSLWELEVYGYVDVGADGAPADDGPDNGSGNDSGSGGDDDSGAADTQAPSIPAALSLLELGAQNAHISWQAADDNVGVFSYEVYRNGALIGETLATATHFADTGLVPGSEYQYQVRASDTAGNWSALSDALAVSTAAGYPVEGGVTLEWRTPAERENGDYLELDEIGGFEIRYRREGQSSANTLMLGNAYVTSYELNGLSGVYQFSIAVYDTNGLFSRFVDLTPVSYH